MSDPDRVGLSRERRILESGIRDIFTPHRPVTDEALLYGRTDEIRRLVAQINTPGQHCLLYGERGVGKSSLANIVARRVLTTFLRGSLYVHRCDFGTRFADIFRAPLSDVGVELDLQEIERTSGHSTKAGLDKVVAASRSKDSTTRATYRASQELSPSRIADHLMEGPLGGLLIIDEADAIASDDDRRRLAELIKQLSDRNAPLKILVVGVAAVGEALMASHPSVARCMKETQLRRMRDAELADIIFNGQQRVGISFDQEAIDTIVECSFGYPYFTHLLALKCAEHAIALGDTAIAQTHVSQGMKDAVEDAEYSLKRSFDEVSRTANRQSYIEVLAAAATLGSSEFDLSAWKTAIGNIRGGDVRSAWLNSHIRRLASTDGSQIITRVSRGYYRFTDPRMPSFIVMACRDLLSHVFLPDLFSYDAPLGPTAVEAELGAASLNRLYVKGVSPYDPETPPQGSTYIIGRRGSGKTTLLLSGSGVRPNDIVNLSRGEVLAGVQDFLSVVGTERTFSVTLDVSSEIWRAVFDVAVAAHLSRDPSISHHLTDGMPTHRFIEGLCRYGRLESPDVNAVVPVFAEYALENARTDNRPVTMNWISQLAINRVSIADLRMETERVLRSEARRLTVVIDSFEDLTSRYAHYSLALSPLFRYLGRQHLSGPSGPMFHVRCCLPAEVFDRLTSASENPAKDFQNVCVIRWTLDDLEQLVAGRLLILAEVLAVDGHTALQRRLARLASDPQALLGSILPREVINNCGMTEHVLPYMLRHTQLLPRQVLSVFNALLRGRAAVDHIASGHRVDGERVRHAVSDVQNVLALEVVNAHLGHWLAAPQALSTLVPSLPYRFDGDLLQQRYDELGLRRYSRSFSELVGSLIRLGVIGRITTETNQYLIGEFYYLFPTPANWSEDSEFCLHPMFANFEGRRAPAVKPVYPGPSPVAENLLLGLGSD